MQVSVENGQLVIRADIETGDVKSKSGKTLRVASSEGNKPVEIELNGKKTTIVVGFNAYRKPEAA